MPSGWGEYIRKAERSVSRAEGVVSGLSKGYQRVRRRAESQVKAGLMGWLSTVPAEERSKENAFRRIATSASIATAYAAIDAGMANISDMAQPAVYPAGVIVSPEDAQNIYIAANIAKSEAEKMASDLDMDNSGIDFDDIMGALMLDNALNISGIITRDGRRIKEEITRTVSSGEPIATIRNRINNFAINKSYFDLSTLAHPRAVIRNYIYRAATVMVLSGAMGWATKDDAKWTVLPSFEGHSRRVDEELAYTIYTSRELDAKYRDMVKRDFPGADWKGLGLTYNSNEYYIPIWPKDEEEAEDWSKEQRIRIRSRYERDDN